MLQRRIITACIALLFFIKPYAQVNQQTGSAVFSLPMFNWKDDKNRLSSSVALSYTSGNGLKVNEVASNVGQGWNLVAGGVITRMQVGEPDDQKAYGSATNESDIAKYPNGYLYASTPAAAGCPEALTRYPIYEEMNKMYVQHNSVAEDRQQDYFNFQFNGKAGMFVLSKTSNVGVSLGDSKMIITFERNDNIANNTYEGTRTTITAFTIKDVDGLIYKFTAGSKSRMLQMNYCDVNLQQQHTQPDFKKFNVYHQAGFENSAYKNTWIVNSWYLSEIEDAFTHRKIYFNYTIKEINNIAGTDFSHNEEENYSIVTHKTSITKTPELASIDYPDGHQVILNHGAERLDLKGEHVISSVDVKFHTRYLSRYLLNTTYFILNRYGTPISPYQQKMSRLCLRSIQKIGVDLKEDSPPYSFDYFLGSNTGEDFVPPPFSYAKDIWGFYNGDNSRNIQNTLNSFPLVGHESKLSNDDIRGLCFRRTSIPGNGIILNPKHNYARNGLLKQIIYPTGGTLSYDYEQNTAIIIGQTTASEVGGVHVSTTSSTDGGYSNGCANPIVTHYNYVLENGTSPSLWAVEKPVNVVTNYSYYEPEWKYWKWSGGLFGSCAYHFQYPGILSISQSVDLPLTIEAMDAIGPYLQVLSLVTTVMDVIAIAGGSTVVLTWVAVIVEIVGGLFTLGYSCFKDLDKDKTSTVFYNMDLNSVSPLPAQFKRVEVVENQGTIGKTVNTFSSSDDYPLWHEENPDFVPWQRFAPWAYGLPRFSTVYNAAGIKVKETENIYNFNSIANKQTIDYCSLHSGCPVSGLSTNTPSCKCEVKKSSSQRSTDWNNQAFYTNPASYKTATLTDVLNVNFYAMYTGRIPLLETHERIFKGNDDSQALDTKTEYYYKTETFPVHFDVTSIVATHSNGDIVTKYFTYSSDYSTGVFATLAQNNVTSLPVSTTTSIRKYNTWNNNIIDEKKTEFVQLPTGDIKPSRTREYRVNNLSTTFSEKTTQEFTYDATGNLIGIKDEGERLVTNIYGYEDKYIIASVINADPVVDKSFYTSFEESTVFGAWTKTGSEAGTYPIPAITGSQSFSASSAVSLMASSLNTSKPYRLSFWATASLNVTVTSGSATLKKSEPVINGFTFYEYDISQGASAVQVAMNGNNIDELRLYPQSARMRTISYDPLIGKTSECDENNRTTYYAYDNLGRLKLIKDDYGNIVKMYEYNNVSAAKQNGCPTIYYNKLIKEIYTRNDCAVGYLGGNVPITIAANTYSSAISQADADAKAENALLASAQTTANSGGSCTKLYYNTLQIKGFETQSCAPGNVGGNVYYAVPANKYSSTINVADANLKAQVEIDASGQAYANSHPSCTYSTVPVWSYIENGPKYCKDSAGVTYLFAYEKDLNPNSSTYNQTRWINEGPKDSTETCTTLTIYARMELTDHYTDVFGTTANLWLRFYFDENCTIPINVNNLTVNYDRVRTSCQGGYPLISPYTITGSGTQISLGNVQVFMDDYHCWTWTWVTTAGTGYVNK